MRSVLCLMLMMSVAAPARAADPRNVVVFSPTVQSSDLEQADLDLFRRALESDLGPVLAPAGYTVLAGETARELLKHRGVDLDALRHGDGYLAAARTAQLSLFMTTRITASKGALVAEIRLFEVASGNIIASGEVEGEDGATLRHDWKKARDRFMTLARQNLGSPASGEDGSSDQVSAKALKEIRVGCERSEPGKCLRLGQLYERGIGVSADASQATEYYGRACASGYSEGCAALHALRERL